MGFARCASRDYHPRHNGEFRHAPSTVISGGLGTESPPNGTDDVQPGDWSSRRLDRRILTSWPMPIAKAAPNINSPNSALNNP